MKKIRVLVTGATGFVGSRLARKLVSDGHDVHIIVRPSSNVDQLSAISGQLKIHVFDGSSDGVLSLMAEAKPTVVFHVASMVKGEHSAQDVAPLIQSNITFGAQLVEGMLACGCQLMVNTGTFWQHYENKKYSPVNLYAASKQAFEAILQYYVEARSIKVITLELFDTYGPNDSRTKLFSQLRKIAVSQEMLAMSPGKQLVDLVHVDDVVNAYLMAAERLVEGKVMAHEKYMVSSFNPIRLKDLVGLYESTINTELLIQWGGRPYREREVMFPWNRGNRLPGWECKIDLARGMGSLAMDA